MFRVIWEYVCVCVCVVFIKFKLREKDYFIAAHCEVKRGQRAEDVMPAGFSLILPSTLNRSQRDG